MFCLTLVLGLFSASKIQSFLDKEGLTLPTISFGNFIGYFLFATLVVLLIVYLPKMKRLRGGIYKFFFIFSAAYGTLIVLSLFFSDTLTLLLTSILIFLWLRSPKVILHDLLMVFGLSGIGAIFGLSLEPKVVLWLLVVFSIYDFIAVYKTKHMIKMAKSMLGKGAIMGLISPQKISGFLEDSRKIKPGENFLILGGGDVIFPLIFSASLLSQGIGDALIVSFFSLMGLVLSFSIFVFARKRQPIPALPPIALLSIIGYIIIKLF